MIDYETKLIALLGTPLSQSLSPRMQNAAYAAMGLNYAYLPVEVGPEGFEAVVKALRHMPFAGFAVTKPYKVDVVACLDELDESVQMTGSCNTVLIRDGRFTGYNTDGVGCIRSLQEQGGLDIAGKRFFCYGAGGTGMAVCPLLAKHGAQKVFIVDIDGRAERLAQRINARCPATCEALPSADVARIAAEQPTADVVMNLTGLGMSPHTERTPARREWLRSGQLCYDANYNNPEKTRFLLDAEAQGCKTLNGLGMLLYQAVEQIRLWTGREAPMDVMRREIRL